MEIKKGVHKYTAKGKNNSSQIPNVLHALQTVPGLKDLGGKKRALLTL